MDGLRMVENVRELRSKTAESEKVTINLGYVDLGHIDLMVQEGFYSNRTRMRDSGACAGRGGIRRAVGVDVERPRGALDDLLRDHHFLDPLETRQIEHRVEQNALHDRAQPPCSRFTLHRLLAIAPSASSGRVRSTLSISNRRWYC